MTKKQIEKAQALEGEGYSQREIAEVLGVPLATLNRSLKAERDSEALAGTEDDDDEQAVVSSSVAKKSATSGTTTADVQLRALELQHEREMAELDYKRKQLDSDSQAMKLKESELELQKAQLKQQQQEREQDEAKESLRIEERKTLLVNKFNRLVREVLHNCKEATWEADDVNDFNERVEALKKKLVKFCTAQNIDEEELAIYHNINALLKFWTETKEESTGFFSDDVELDLEKDKVAEIRGWLIEDFYDELPDDEEEDDEDEDEEDDEDEDDEEEDDDEEQEDDEDEEQEDDEDEDEAPRRKSKKHRK